MEDTIRELQDWVARLTLQLTQDRGGSSQERGKDIRAFKGRVFEGDEKLSVEEFLYQLQNHFDMGRITESKDKILILTLGVAGSASIWVRQWRETNREKGFGDLERALKERFQDKLKAQKTYNKLLNMR